MTRKVTIPPPPPPLPPSKSKQRPRSLQAPAHPHPPARIASYDELRLTFKPCYFFFYGSLMDPGVLQTVLSLPDAPSVQKASIKGFKTKMWGIYPTLIKGSDGGEVHGTVWQVGDVGQFLKLAEYETSAYTTCICEITKEDGEVISDGRTFCWAGDPESRELEDGVFDFERYQRYFKPSVVRKRIP